MKSFAYILSSWLDRLDRLASQLRVAMDIRTACLVLAIIALIAMNRNEPVVVEGSSVPRGGTAREDAAQ